MLKNSRFLVLLVLVVTSSCCKSPAPETGPLSEEDVAAIKSLGPAMDKAALAGDWAAILDLMTEDVTWIGPHGPPIQGRNACHSWLAAANPTITVHEVEFREVEGHGDMAYATGPYVETMTVEGIDGLFEDTGNVLAVVRKQPDGAWLIAIWMWNSDLPLPAEG